jgi:ArsR family transcriptional regulator
MELVKILKILSDINRLRILNLLKTGKLCVCRIEEILGMTQSNASRHLNKLKDAGLVLSEKKAQWVHYQLNIKNIHKYSFLTKLLYEDLSQIPDFKAELAKAALLGTAENY